MTVNNAVRTGLYHFFFYFISFVFSNLTLIKEVTHNWQVNDTSLIINNGNLTIQRRNDVKLVKSGKVIINSNSQLLISSGGIDIDTQFGNSDSGIDFFPLSLCLLPCLLSFPSLSSPLFYYNYSIINIRSLCLWRHHYWFCCCWWSFDKQSHQFHWSSFLQFWQYQKNKKY